MRFFLHAPNIHQGGGLVLLKELLRCADSVGIYANLHCHLMEMDGLGNLNIEHIPSTVFGRLKAEWSLRKLNSNDKLLCFGNLPPLFGSSAQVFVYLQNRLLIDQVALSDYPFKARFRLSIERLWLRMRVTHKTQIIVQTQSMQQLVSNRLGLSAKVLPISAPVVKDNIKNNTESKNFFDFVYVASGDPHKNHKKLVEAWCLLRKDGLKPSLALTLSKVDDPELFIWVTKLVDEFDLKIEIIGQTDRNRIHNLYSVARCHIYPSLIESYGLPLVESMLSGLPVIASERDFVRDVCEPIETFDPQSALSICRAVKRFLGASAINQCQLTPIEFFSKLS
jgi:glycosyltransferase involved in cell wall biosynthesis